jgi:diguanylate cyclase (GGDEF)-like protein/PAS domain S-box-containing protein
MDLPNHASLPIHATEHSLPPDMGNLSLDRAVANTADAMLIIDMSDTIRYASASAETLFGRASSSLIGSLFGFPLGSSDPVDMELIQPDGTIVFAEMRVELLQWSGAQAHVVWLHDVTNRKNAEQRLLESQQFLTLTLDSLSSHVAILDSQGRIVAVNTAWRQFGGAHEYADLPYGLGSNYLDICDYAASNGIVQAGMVADGIRSVLNQQQVTFSLEYPSYTDKKRWFSVHVTSFHQGLQIYSVIVHHDISDRKSVETALKLFQSVVQATSEAIIITDVGTADTDPRIIFANAAFEQTTGYSLAVIRGTSAVPFLSTNPQDDTQAWFRQAANGVPVYGETTLVHPNRSRYACEWSLSPVAGTDGSVQQFVAVIRDVTARKRTAHFERTRTHVLELMAQSHNLTIILDELLAILEYLEAQPICAWVIAAGKLTYYGTVPIPDDRLLDLSNAWMRDLDPMAPLSLVHALENIADDPSLIAIIHNLRLVGAWIMPVFSGTIRLATLVIGLSNIQLPLNYDTLMIEQIRHLMAIAIEQFQRNQQLNYQAHYDGLTGLPNRVLFEDRLQHDIDQAKRAGDMLAVLFIDLDRFKQINDTLGHPIGDALLREAAQRLLHCTRTSDTLARRGGDEFMIAVPHLKDIQVAATIAQRINETLNAVFVIEDNELFITASIGISLYPTDGSDMNTLQRNADAAMYRVKSLTRNGFQFFSVQMSQGAIERLQIENHLRRAIERGEFELAYQPLYQRDGQIIAAEALLRWTNPELGSIAPQVFIPIAEESGLIIPIGNWILQQACRQARAWQDDGLPPIRVCVNVSAMQFAQPRFCEYIKMALAESKLDGQWLELELTESMLIGNFQEITHQLNELRHLHIGLAIDDFGTGYSSLSYLQRMPISMLKIDQSFIQALTAVSTDGNPNTSTAAIVQAMSTLAQSLHMQVTVEGVETAEQLEILKPLHYDRSQGFLFSRPLPSPDLEQLLRSQQA